MDRDHDFDQTIDTLATTVALRDGILHIRSKGIVSTDESVQQTITASLSLTGGQRRPVLFDARVWPGGDPQGWMTVINELRTAFSAGAMVVSQAALEGLSDRMDAFGRLLIPFHVCTDIEEAKTFLEPFAGRDRTDE